MNRLFRAMKILLLSAVVFPGVPLYSDLLSADEPVVLSRDLKKGLVILVKFPGLDPGIGREEIARRFRRLDRYVKEMSYGKAAVETDLTEWYGMPLPVGKYAISPSNLKVDKSRVSRLIQDAVDAAGRDHDFSRYTFVVLFLGARFREYGMIGLCGYPGMLGWSRSAMLKTSGGQPVPGGVAIFTSQAHLGTLFHDCAHVWGGVRDGKRVLPCLYDHDLQEKYPTRDRGWEKALINMGYWDPMSCHMISFDVPPPGISSWTRIRLGWLAPEKIAVMNPDVTTEIVLGPLGETSSEVLALKIPLTEHTYYLAENRRKTGSFDSVLPGEGILVMYCDDRIAECRNGKAPVKLRNADPRMPGLRGAAFRLPDRPRFTDRENGIEITLVEETGHSYKVRVGRVRPGP